MSIGSDALLADMLIIERLCQHEGTHHEGALRCVGDVAKRVIDRLRAQSSVSTEVAAAPVVTVTKTHNDHGGIGSTVGYKYHPRDWGHSLPFGETKLYAQPQASGVAAVDAREAEAIADKIDRITRGASSNYLFAGAGRAPPIPENQCINVWELLVAAAALRQCVAEQAATDALVRHMVHRFLGWRLPKPWSPDNGISYARPNYAHPPADHDWPVGTNLFSATEAEAMVRYMLEGMPAQPQPRAESQPATAAGDGWNVIAVDPQPSYVESSGRWLWPLPKSAQFPGCCVEVVTASREWWEYAPSEAKPHPHAQSVQLRDGEWIWVWKAALASPQAPVSPARAESQPVTGAQP